jgi:DNA-binding NarL/FixJ family response regulator
MNPIKIAIIEDNHFLREGLIQLINGTQGYKCVGAYPDASNVLYNIRRTDPHVILMDIDMPSKMNGIEATFQIKEQFPHIFTIIQTTFEDKSKILQAIRVGASGYLLKNTPPAKLLEAIQDVVAGGSPMTPAIVNKALEMLRESNIATPFETPALSRLTERQKEILEGIVKGKSYKAIADELYITTDTVKFHVKNIYDVLQIHSRHELAARFRK